MKISTVREFLDNLGHYKFSGKDLDQSLISKLVNDFGVDEKKFEFLGVHKNEYNCWDEYMILWKFSKRSSNLAECFRIIGSAISKLDCPGYEFGIQELDTSISDGYYLLMYGMVDRD